MAKPATEALDTWTEKKFTKKLTDRITLTMVRTVTRAGKKVTRTNYKFGSSCHWTTDVASLDYNVDWNCKEHDRINWSCGGCANGFSVEEYALAQAGIFKWMARIARKHGSKA
jgi:hypothetical protein